MNQELIEDAAKMLYAHECLPVPFDDRSDVVKGIWRDRAEVVIRVTGEHLDAAVRGTSTGFQAWEFMRKECGL